MRILIADDSDMVRHGIARLLSSEPNWEVCGEAKDGPEAFRKTRQLLPDLLLLDVSMPGMNGLDVTRLIRREVPQTKIIVMSHHDPVQLLPSVVDAGGNHCIDKGRLGADLVASIKSIEISSGSV